ncbi:hypothetical protein BGX28_007258 [Mortierella sp. GBA30]|nr:hypothetical protein BGX28_007258 [Mortierella sp. GBA30]
MTSSDIHAVLKIPELAGIICQYLPQPERGRLMLTNKAIYCLLQPYFWRDIWMEDTWPHDEVAFQRNLHYTRSITLGVNTSESNLKILVDPFESSSSPTAVAVRSGSCAPTDNPISTSTAYPTITGMDTSLCSNVNRLVIQNEYQSEADDLILLLQHNKNLTHLELCSGFLHLEEKEVCERFAEAVSGLRQLRHFTLKDADLTPAMTLRIMQATLSLPHLRELHIDYPMLPPSDVDPVQLKDVGPMTESILEQAVAIKKAEGTIKTKITALTIPSSQDAFRVSFLLPILQSELFDLDTMQIPATDLHLRGQALQDVLRKYCPKVKHLRCPQFMIEDYRDTSNACIVIQACTGLQSFHSRGFSDDEVDMEPVFEVLLEHHAKTLEDYEDYSDWSMDGRRLQTMLSSCKNLKRVWEVPCKARALEFGHILSKEWICLGMKVLFLHLDRFDAEESEMQEYVKTSRLFRYTRGRLQTDQSVGDDQDLNDHAVPRRHYYLPEADKWAAKRVYAQIGKLVDLEMLGLQVHDKERPPFIRERFTWDLTLKDGYLKELAGLRKLKHLHMASDFWLNMEQDEVEFIDAQWPVLGEISFDMVGNRSGFQELVAQPHWQWLLERRPTLRYSNFDRIDLTYYSSFERYVGNAG